MLAEDISTALQTSGYLEGKRYEREVLTRLDLDKMEFEAAVFTQCRFLECDFSGCSFYNVTLDTCDFTGSRFGACYFKNARLLDCRGDGCNFSRGSFLLTALEKGSFCYANFSGSLWDRSKITESVLKHAFLSEAKFKKLSLDRADLTHTDLFKTPLKGVDFSTCVIDGITLSDSYAELRGAKVSAEQAIDLAMLLGVQVV